MMYGFPTFLRYLKPGNLNDRITFLQWFNFIEKSQWWGKEEIETYQWNKIKALLKYSNEFIPYYHELFNTIGANPEDIKSWSDFRKIPYLTKEIIRERSSDLVSIKIKKSKLRYITTGGSTGIPLGFYKCLEDQTISRAFMINQWSRIGYNEDSRRVILRAEPIKNNQLYLKYRFGNDWLLSSYHISEKFIKQYVDILNHIKPQFFHVHPSTFYYFTQVFLESKLKLNFKPIAILCGSEPVYFYQRDLFEKTYEARVYSWLGLAEDTILAGECEFSSSLHIWPEHSYVELVDDYDSPILSKGQAGYIIGTTIKNFDTPLIRYRSGDLATFGSQACPLCHRQHVLIDSVDGREQAVIVNKDGTNNSAHSIPYLIVHKSDIFDRIKMIQIIQEVIGVITMRLDTTKDFTKEDEEEIRNIISTSFNKQFSIIFEYSNDFIRTKSGKHIFFIQRIKNPI